MKRAWVAVVLMITGCMSSTGGPRSEALLPKAEELFLAGQYAQAAGHYEAYLADNLSDPRRDEIRVRIGTCRLGAGQPEPALRAFESALVGNLPPATRLEAIFRSGVARRLLGAPQKALEDFRVLDASEPHLLDGAGLTVDEVHYERALARFRAGDWSQGQADLARVGPRGPFGPRARTRLGLSAYAVQVGAFETESPARSLGVRTPGSSVRTLPGDPPLHVVTVGKFSRFEEAQRDLERLRASGHPEAFVVP